MQAYIKLNNDILNAGLTPNELKVAVCLYSCVYNKNFVVQIKQSTIAKKCSIKTISTIGNIICKLQEKGIIESVKRPYKSNGWLGTHLYKLKAVSSKGYFKMKRYILGKLTGIQLRMYLFICRAVTKKNDMWNSFNDISRSLQMARNKVIAIINELVSLGVIQKKNVIKSDGSYSDNHYSVIEPELKKQDKKECPEQATNSFGTKNIKVLYNDYKPYCVSCQHCQMPLYDFYSGVVP